MTDSFVTYWWRKLRLEHSLVDLFALALLYTAMIGVGVSALPL